MDLDRLLNSPWFQSKPCEDLTQVTLIGLLVYVDDSSGVLLERIPVEEVLRRDLG